MDAFTATLTLVDILRLRAIEQPTREAFTFLIDGENDAQTFTYAQLDRQARAIAAQLQQRAAPGDRVLLLLSPGPDYIAAFFGCLYAGVIAVPAYPPHPAHIERSLPRLAVLAHDAQPRVALTTSALVSVAARLLVEHVDFQSIQWLPIDDTAQAMAGEWQEQAIHADTTAFLQYTSGSTSTPKGVVLSHSNLLHNLKLIHQGFAHTPESRGVIWLPPYHDMGLIGGILQPIYGGFPVTLMPPISFLQAPIRWLQAISRYRATTSGGPNFAYELCIQKSTLEQRAELDLHSWKVAFNGAEPIRAHTLERFTKLFRSCGFRSEAFFPCYGLAEATLMVTGSRVDEHPIVQPIKEQGANAVAHAEDQQNQRALVGSGQPFPDHHTAIVDPDSLKRCQPGEVGEIWVKGPSVAQGYWNRTEATEQTFRARIAETGEGPFLRTGDLGLMIDDELFVTGRLKDLIIIRGQNYYPQDIELTVENSHPALRRGAGAAFTIEVDDQERLVVVQEVERQHRRVPVAEVASAIRQQVAAQHELQVYAVALLKPARIPKTSSGKIQRHACRIGFLNDQLELIGRSVLQHVASDSDVEAAATTNLDLEALLMIPATARAAALTADLRRRVARMVSLAPEQIEPAQPITAVGLDSLMAIELQHEVEDSLALSLPLTRLLAGPTLIQLAADLLAQVETPPLTDHRGPELSGAQSSRYPLSHGQRGIWFLHHISPDLPAYTIGKSLQIRGELDQAALKRAFQMLVDRHEVLRTTFSLNSNSEPFQYVHEQSDADVQFIDAGGWDAPSLERYLDQEAARPFDLEHGPLFRARLLTRSPQDHVLLVTIHHIIVDFWSLMVLFHELRACYIAATTGTQPELARVDRRYSDYVNYQDMLLGGSAGDQLRAYWRQKLAGELPSLDLWIARPQPAQPTYKAAAQHFMLSTELVQQLQRLSQAHGATLYTTVLAALYVLLWHYSGQDDLLVGSPMAGRTRREVRDQVGYFVNPIPLRANLAGNPSFSRVLAQVRQTVIDAIDHQDYPLLLLVEELRRVRVGSQSQLFQTILNWQKAQFTGEKQLTLFALDAVPATVSFGPHELTALPLEQPTARFDLEWTMAEVDSRIYASLVYSLDRFDGESIHRLLSHFQTLLQEIAAAPEQPIGRLALLMPEEHQQLLERYDARQQTDDPGICLHQLFTAQVLDQPEAIALTFGAGTDEQAQLSYAALDRWSNQIAHGLLDLDLDMQRPIALLVGTSFEQIALLLGVLKAGGMFVCLDLQHPTARLQQILGEVQPVLLITEGAIVRQHAALFSADQQGPAGNMIVLDQQNPFATRPTSDPALQIDSSAAAYIAYTSGSTGRPKGIVQSHRSFCQFLTWQSQQFAIQPSKRVAQWATITYDAAYCEIFGALCFGATLCLTTPDVRYDPPALLRWVGEQRITLLQVVPSFCRQLLYALETTEQPAANPYPALETMMLAGEAISLDLVQSWFERFPSGPKLYNLYGPTESVLATYYPIERSSLARRSIPIGRPIAGRHILIISSAGQLCPIGIPGELHIRSDYLTSGYFQWPEATAKAFIQNPLHADYPDPVYRTGDLGRYLPDGTIEFLGRTDHQVKVRGMRVELNEIEAALLQHPAVRECVVVAQRYDSHELRLIGYIVGNQGSQADGADPSDLGSSLQRMLKQALPPHMVPTAFVTLEALPRTVTGKIDRNALPQPDRIHMTAEELVAPQTIMERQVAAVWQEVLHLDRIGMGQNFFDLGGHSLSAMQVTNKLRAIYAVDLPLRDFLAAPTLTDLVQLIEARQPSVQRQLNQIARIYEQVQQLSDDEVRALLQQKRTAI